MLHGPLVKTHTESRVTLEAGSMLQAAVSAMAIDTATQQVSCCHAPEHRTHQPGGSLALHALGHIFSCHGSLFGSLLHGPGSRLALPHGRICCRLGSPLQIPLPSTLQRLAAAGQQLIHQIRLCRVRSSQQTISEHQQRGGQLSTHSTTSLCTAAHDCMASNLYPPVCSCLGSNQGKPSENSCSILKVFGTEE